MLPKTIASLSFVGFDSSSRCNPPCGPVFSLMQAQQLEKLTNYFIHD